MQLSIQLLLAFAAVPLAYAQKCSPLELVYARATIEAQASLGLVGTPFFSALKTAVPGATSYNVVYPAAFGDASPIKGIEDVLRYFNTKPKACPQQKYVISGYSQGAVVMHRAAVKMDKSILKDRIIAAVTFGDGGQQATKEKPEYKSPVGPIPIWPAELDGKIKFNCNGKDLTCNPSGSSTADHIAYVGAGKKYVSDSAAFVKDAFAKAGGVSAPPAGASAPIEERGLAALLPVTKAMFFRA